MNKVASCGGIATSRDCWPAKTSKTPGLWEGCKRKISSRRLRLQNGGRVSKHRRIRSQDILRLRRDHRARVCHYGLFDNAGCAQVLHLLHHPGLDDAPRLDSAATLK